MVWVCALPQESMDFRAGWLRGGALGTGKRGCLGVLPKHWDWPLRRGWSLVGAIRASVFFSGSFGLDHTLGSVPVVPRGSNLTSPKTREEWKGAGAGPGSSGRLWKTLGTRARPSRLDLGFGAGREPGPLHPTWLVLKQPILSKSPPPPFHLGSSDLREFCGPWSL